MKINKYFILSLFIYRANTGSRFNPVLSVDNSHTSVRRPAAKWWDAAAFAIPTASTFGTAGRNILLGLGASLSDFLAQKNFHVREKQ